MNARMSTIIESPVNADFLKEARDLGYRPYVDHFKTSMNDARTPNFYLGSVQRRIRDDLGIRYFVGIDMFDIGQIDPNRIGTLSANAKVQFWVDDTQSRVVDVDYRLESIEDAEAFFARMWSAMGFGYYERD